MTLKMETTRRSNFKLLTTGPICHASRQCSALLRFQAKPISAGRHGSNATDVEFLKLVIY